MSLWHSRLGHASALVVKQILSYHKIPFVSNLNKHAVCDACQKGRAINCLTLVPQVCQLVPCNSFFLMFGVLHPVPLEEINIMSASLIIIVNSLGFIFSSSNLMCFRDFMSSKILSKDSLTEKLFLCKLIEVESIKNFIPSLKKSA